MKLYLPTLGKAFASLILCSLGMAQVASAQQQPHDTRLIQINVLAASKSGKSELADLPANTRKAIEDIQDFLPFNSYRILDTSLVRSLVADHRKNARLSRTFMSGPDNSKLEIKMLITGDGSELYIDNFEVRPSIRGIHVVPSEQEGQGSSSKVAIAPFIAQGPLISTTFTAKVGQTVVVGSSRLNGGEEALIVLFTALP